MVRSESDRGGGGWRRRNGGATTPSSQDSLEPPYHDRTYRESAKRMRMMQSLVDKPGRHGRPLTLAYIDKVAEKLQNKTPTCVVIKQG
jgi:hypothetical protein